MAGEHFPATLDEATVMQTGKQSREAQANSPHYLNMIDLYAARAIRNRVVPLQQPEPPPVVFIGRRPRPSFSILATWKRNPALNTGHRRMTTAATVIAVFVSILAGVTWAG